MSSTLKHALKEWAVICRALAEGRQAVLLRKGGIAETSGDFRLEHTCFWLYPTYVHQQREGLKPTAAALLGEVEADRPPAGLVRLSHFAEVTGAYWVQDLATALKLDDLHLWSQETVTARFAYRRPGLFVLPVRVYRATQTGEMPETPYYAGCKSWVELARDLPTEGAVPALPSGQFEQLLWHLNDVLKPTALA
jgi:hypothetical protein